MFDEVSPLVGMPVDMYLWIDDETGKVYGYASDGSQDAYILPGLRRMTEEEEERHKNPPMDPEAREELWRSSELEVVKDNLEAILFEDPDALPGTEVQWKAYGLALRKWKEGAAGYPEIESRPKRP